MGGGIGAILRYGVSMGMASFTFTRFPLATLLSNVLASLLLGIFSVLVIRSNSTEIAQQLQAFLVIGICGGFSTFSTFSRENLTFLEQGNWLMLILNTCISVALTLCFIYIGKKLVA